VAAALGFAAQRARAADPVIAAAGDIACDPDDSGFAGGSGTSTKCRQKHTSDLLVGIGLARVLVLGDLQYNSASLDDFRRSYDPSWGRVKAITSPALGNHEPGSGTGYFDYFNGAGRSTGPAGERGKGYYSYDVGAWHLIALNSNCSRVSCSAGSAQERWLRADLASNASGCTLAYWHHPRFSSGHDGDNTFTQPLWQALFDAQADVVLVGHSHDYERYAPQDARGRKDTARGIREFVVGTGGSFFTGISSARPNSEVRQNNTYGILKLTLHPTTYEWRFVPEAGKRFTDSGIDSCHGPNTTLPVPLVPTPPPAGLAPPAGSPGFSGAGSRPGSNVVSLAEGTPHRGGGVHCTTVGTERRDHLDGGAGSDVVCGLGGRDVIRGGDGDDVIVGGGGKDRLIGGRGNDRLYGNARRDILRGQSGNDRLVGGKGPDRIYGNAGNDKLRSVDRYRPDRVFGGRGFDRAWVNLGDRVRRVERVVHR
jgi:acid phosphatase type 7